MTIEELNEAAGSTRFITADADEDEDEDEDESSSS